MRTFFPCRLSVKKYPKNRCLGYRTKRGGVDTGYLWWNYEEVDEMSRNIAKAIEHEKLYSEVEEFGKWRILICQMQMVQVEQLILTLALWHLGATMMSETEEFRPMPEFHTIATSVDDLARILELKQNGKIPNIKTVLVFGQVGTEDKKKAEVIQVRLIEFEWLINEGKKYPEIGLPGSRRDDISIIIETSGTTGYDKV